jgi:hypothetical protein
MGIRRSYGKNKKSNRPTEAATVEREGVQRRATKVRESSASRNSGPKRPAK